jgi:hypothetical protein
MPFMDAPPGGSLSSVLNKPYGAFIRRMRGISNIMLNTEPKWRHNGPALTSGMTRTGALRAARGPEAAAPMGPRPAKTTARS